MLNKPDYITARDLLLRTVRPVQTERIPLWEAAGRVPAGVSGAGGGQHRRNCRDD